MKTILFSAISILFFLTTSCTKESLLEVDINPNLTSFAANSKKIDQQDDIENWPVAFISGGNSTIESPVSNSSTTANELVVDFSNSNDFDGVKPIEAQDLNFEDAQGNGHSFSFLILDYGESGSFYQITFDLDGRDLSGLQMKPTQMIVVEDITIN